jgi:hypothetical protein
MKLFSFFLLILELVLMVVEIRKANEMWKLGIGIKKMSEEERRAHYGKKTAILSLVIMVLFMILLIISVASVKPEDLRNTDNILTICDPRQALETATCVDCVDRNCNVCAEDSKICNECDGGFVISKTDGCVKCKDNCETCEDKTELCTKCQYGYILNSENNCVKCDDKSYLECEECYGVDELATSTVCTQCASNHRLENG